MPKTAAVYCRISDDRNGSAAGVKRQQVDCLALAERQGWTVAPEHVFVDNDVSAYRGRARKAYRRMLEAVATGEVGAVIAWHPDRLTRHPRELEDLIDLLEKTKARVATVTAGEYDLGTPTGRAVARTVGAWARHESEHKGERTRRKHQELAEAGRAVGGGRPFGYEDDRVTIRENEAVLIRGAAARLLAGDSVRSIAKDWSEAGVQTPHGNPCGQKFVRNLLLSHRLAGNRSMGKEGPVVARGCWPAILDQATHDRLRAVLLDPERHVSGFGARRYLLSGFLFCGKCQKRLLARPHRNRQRSYVCGSGPGTFGCGGLRVVAEPLEDEVVKGLFGLFDSAAFNSKWSEPVEDGGLDEQIGADVAALEQLARDHYADRVIGRGEYLAARAALDARLETAKRQRARERGTLALAGIDGSQALRAAWEGYSLDRKRAIIAAVLDRVVVGPGKPGRSSFDPARIGEPYGPVWKA